MEFQNQRRPFPVGDWTEEKTHFQHKPNTTSTPIFSTDAGQQALNIAVKKIGECPDKGKHHILNKMAYTIGGYIGAGLVKKEVAYNSLKDAIDRCDCENYDLAYRTIDKALEDGEKDPVSPQEYYASSTWDYDEAPTYNWQFIADNSFESAPPPEPPPFYEPHEPSEDTVDDSPGQSEPENQEKTQKQTYSNNLQLILKARRKLLDAKGKKVVFASPIISREGTGIIYPNTINVIQAKDGMHKSRLAGITCSALLKRPGCDRTHLGFTADFFKSYTVLYVDTERNLRDQLPFALQQIQLQSGFSIEEEPQNFDFISLLEFDREQRLPILSEYLEYARKQYTNHIFIVLDVVTDCIGDFNNVKESLKLIDLMNRLINTYDVTFLCIIHENPGSEKARGNIGTEIINKATTALQLDFEKDRNGEPTDVIKVKYRKCRMSAKPKPFFMRYDKDESLVLADHVTVDGSTNLCPVAELRDWLESELTEPKTKQELFTAAKTKFGCGNRTLEDRIKEIIDEEFILFDKEGRESYLTKERDGKQTVFKLKPLPDETN